MMNQKLRNMITEARDMAVARNIKTSINFHHENSHLMRIGNNSVSLNTSEELTRIDIEVIKGRRKGTHTLLGQLSSAEKLFEMILMVSEKTDKSAEMDYQPVLTEIEKSVEFDSQYDEDLELLDPAEKERIYSAIIKSVGAGYNYSGSWSSGSTETFLVTTANSNSVWHKATDQQFTCVLKNPEKMWELASWQTGWRAFEVTALNTIRDFKNLLPVYEGNPGFKVDPGHYKVVLGSQAIADILEMSIGTGCDGRTWEMKMGWTAEKQIGDEILHSSVTILDDPWNNQVFSDPVSDSGMLTKTLPMVEKGKFAGLMYDRNTASKYSRKATPNAGCFAMEPGDAPADFLEAVKDLDRVLFIPAIHYTNMPNMSKGIFTGSSRFSAVLVEKGKIVCPIFSTRITDQFDTIFGKVLAIASQTVSVNTSNTYGRRSPSAVSVPLWILVDDVKITDCADSF
jgi:predicted Zn-dependent protease